MKNYLNSYARYLLALFALALVLPTFSEEKEEEKSVWSYYAELSVARNSASDKMGYTFYNNVSTKLADKYKLTVDFSHGVTDKDGSLEAELSHNYLRFLVTGDPVAKWGDWDFGIDYRYRAPTDEGSQKAGTLGRLKPRFWVKTKFGESALNIRMAPIFYLNRYSQRFDPDGDDKKRCVCYQPFGILRPRSDF